MRDSLYHLCGNVSRLSGSLADPRASFGTLELNDHTFF